MEIQSAGEGAARAPALLRRPRNELPPLRSCLLQAPVVSALSSPSSFVCSIVPQMWGEDARAPALRERERRAAGEPVPSGRRPLCSGGQFPHEAQGAVPAPVTERRILARDAQRDRLPILALLRLGDRRSSDTEQRPAARQLPIAMSMSQQAVVTNAHESMRQDVQQEA